MFSRFNFIEHSANFSSRELMFCVFQEVVYYFFISAGSMGQKGLKPLEFVEPLLDHFPSRILIDM